MREKARMLFVTMQKQTSDKPIPAQKPRRGHSAAVAAIKNKAKSHHSAKIASCSR